MAASGAWPAGGSKHVPIPSARDPFWPGLLAALSLLPSWLGLGGSWHWVLDLFAHFRWQYLIAGFVVIGWALWRGQRTLLVLALATTMLNAWLIGMLAWQPALRSVQADGDFLLRALSLNVLTSNPHKERVIAHLHVSGADVVVLTEVDQAWADALEALSTEYPHRIVHARPDNFGLALLSRLPLSEEQVLGDGRSQRPSIMARIRHQGRSVVVIGTHPPPPMGATLASMRDRQMQALRELVEQRDEPVIMLGDFNASPWSAPMRALTSGRLGFRSQDPPWTPTWLPRTPFAVSIDHVLTTAPLVITRRDVGPDVGSDHRPVLVELRWMLKTGSRENLPAADSVIP